MCFLSTHLIFIIHMENIRAILTVKFSSAISVFMSKLFHNLKKILKSVEPIQIKKRESNETYPDNLAI